ncbi:MAG: hypothetical protein RR842_07565 [Gordonibacter sp.]|uniref:hypothetical protein n=1 Tax=Gordonibacter sp. TaxID=1968902 RepID=UPI002FCC12B8
MSEERYVSRVCENEAVWDMLLESAEAVSSSETEEETENLAGDLFLETLLSVGVSPHERYVREIIERVLLADDSLSSIEIQRAVDYLLSQMIVKPKGVLAERLALSFCRKHLDSKLQKPSSSCVKLARYCRSPQMSRAGDSHCAGRWAQAADILFLSSSLDYQHECEQGNAVPDSRMRESDIVVVGLAEVKSYRHTTRKKLAQQVDHHLLRLMHGLRVYGRRGKEIEAEYLSEHIWFMVSNGGKKSVLNASDIVSETALKEDQGLPSCLASFDRVTIGPAPNKRFLFDYSLQLTESELEDIGIAIAFYTIGCYADQPNIDLPGWEWSDNLRKVFACKVETLSSSQVRRRDKLLGHLYE